MDCQHLWTCQVFSEILEMQRDIPSRYVAACGKCGATIKAWDAEQFWAVLGETENIELQSAVEQIRIGNEPSDWWKKRLGQGQRILTRIEPSLSVFQLPMNATE